MRHFQTPAFRLLVLLAIAATLRGALLCWRFEELTVDRDAYLGIAENLWNHGCYCLPGTHTPTAFRPPFFILIVALARGVGGVAGLALYQLVAGVVTVWASYEVGRRLLDDRLALLAAGIVTFDPLLLRYTTLPMTELTFTMLLMLGGWAWIEARSSRWSLGVCGLLFGLAALTRPSLWPMLAPLVLFGFLHDRMAPKTESRPPSMIRQALVVSAIAILIALPWGLRNAWVMGQFKLTTTHGGYTLLLGNNSTFYEAVLHQPLGTTWGDYPEEHPLSQATWYRHLQEDLDNRGLNTEFARDRAQYEMAFQQVRQHPGDFLQSIGLRLIRLWSPVPAGPQAERLSPFLLAGLWAFSLTLYLLAIIGLIRQLGGRDQEREWLWFLALIATLCLVHAFFWSNARMRAPFIPALALLAARAFLDRSPRT